MVCIYKPLELKTALKAINLKQAVNKSHDINLWIDKQNRRTYIIFSFTNKNRKWTKEQIVQFKNK